MIIAFPAVLQLAFGISLAVLEANTATAEARIRHSKEVLLRLGQVEKETYDLTIAVLSLTMNRRIAAVEVVNKRRRALLDDVKTLPQLMTEDDRQRRNAQSLITAVDDYTSDLDNLIDAVKENDEIKLKLLGVSFWRRLTDLGGLEDRVIDPIRLEEEEKLRSEPGLARDARQLLRGGILLGLLLNTLASVGAAVYFLRDIAFRVRRISKNAELLGMGQDMLPQLTGKDEIASLDRVLHKMAQHLKDASRRETALVSNAADVILCIDKSFLISSINKACLSNFGYETSDLMSMRFMNLVPQDQREAAHRILSEAMSSTSSVHADISITCKSEEIRTFNWNILWSAEDELLFCVAHDVSEARRIERVKRDFVSMVSHDLRTPLTGMSAFVEMLELGAYGSLNQMGQERATEVGNSLVRLMNMVNELLEIEKMESGKLELHPAEIDCKDLLRSSLDMVQGFAEQQKIKIEPSCSAGKLVCDEARIVQVIQNLVSNAVKFSPPETTVKLSISPDGSKTRFEVQDQGPGIAPGDIAKLFDRFSQAESSGAKRRQGYGLGLAICKEIVEGHGGSIHVESELSKGSKFWFVIP